ncbi:hypothetical protein ABZ783_30535 [Micromonospora sp. NPDC047738]|uniref:hypothetical protein n=1 Tax=Micromonospora sp. NPDC047738 TaxID=3155741 RepID=UPI0033E98A35
MELMSAASLSPAGSFDVSVVSERVWIPYRLYADEPAVEAQRTLAPLQQAVLSCLYSRHHDGYVRQRHIERIAPRAEDWIAPFVVHLIGEYVLEIVLRIKDELADIRLPGTAMHTVYGRFAAANANFITLTSQRAASYWNCYHRHRYPKVADYPATILLTSIRDAARCPSRPPDDQRDEPLGPCANLLHRGAHDPGRCRCRPAAEGRPKPPHAGRGSR